MGQYKDKKMFKVVAILMVMLFMFQAPAFALNVKKQDLGWRDKEDAWTGGGRDLARDVGIAVVTWGISQYVAPLISAGASTGTTMSTVGPLSETTSLSAAELATGIGSSTSYMIAPTMSMNVATGSVTGMIGSTLVSTATPAALAATSAAGSTIASQAIASSVGSSVGGIGATLRNFSNFKAGALQGLKSFIPTASKGLGLTSGQSLIAYGAARGAADIGVATKMSPDGARFLTGLAAGLGSFSPKSLPASLGEGVSKSTAVAKGLTVAVGTSAAQAGLEVVTAKSSPYLGNFASFSGGLAAQHAITGAVGGYEGKVKAIEEVNQADVDLDDSGNPIAMSYEKFEKNAEGNFIKKTYEGLAAPKGISGAVKGLAIGAKRDWLPVVSYAVNTGVGEGLRSAGVNPKAANFVSDLTSGVARDALQAKFDAGTDNNIKTKQASNMDYGKSKIDNKENTAAQNTISKGKAWGNILVDSLVKNTISSGLDYAVDTAARSDGEAIGALAASSLVKATLGYLGNKIGGPLAISDNYEKIGAKDIPTVVINDMRKAVSKHYSDGSYSISANGERVELQESDNPGYSEYARAFRRANQAKSGVYKGYFVAAHDDLVESMRGAASENLYTSVSTVKPVVEGLNKLGANMEQAHVMVMTKKVEAKNNPFFRPGENLSWQPGMTFDLYASRKNKQGEVMQYRAEANDGSGESFTANLINKDKKEYATIFSWPMSVADKETMAKAQNDKKAAGKVPTIQDALKHYGESLDVISPAAINVTKFESGEGGQHQDMQYVEGKYPGIQEFTSHRLTQGFSNKGVPEDKVGFVFFGKRENGESVTVSKDSSIPTKNEFDSGGNTISGFDNDTNWALRFGLSSQEGRRMFDAKEDKYHYSDFSEPSKRMPVVPDQFTTGLNQADNSRSLRQPILEGINKF